MLTPTLLESRELAVEHRVQAHLAFEPPKIAGVDDKPAFAGDSHAVVVLLERCLRNHRLQTSSSARAEFVSANSALRKIPEAGPYAARSL